MHEGASSRCPPQLVHSRAGQLFSLARPVLGDRFIAGRVEPDRSVLVRILDLTEEDTTALSGIAEQLGLGGRARFRNGRLADLPKAVRLRKDVIRLLDEQPTVLRVYPPPDAAAYRRPPLRVELAPGAEITAAELWDSYGEYLDLRVGDLPFPFGRVPLPAWQPRPLDSDRQRADPGELHIELDGPLTVPSGSFVKHAILLKNHSATTIALHTNGSLTAVILDPKTGGSIGGYTSPQHLRGVLHTIAPAQTVRVPLLVGTDSFDLGRGYSIPAGTWQLIAPLNLDGGRRLITAPLSLVIAEPD